MVHAHATFEENERPTQPRLGPCVAERPSLRPTAPPPHARVTRTGKGLPAPEPKPAPAALEAAVVEKVTLAPPPRRQSGAVRRRASADVEVVLADLRRDPRSEE